MKHKTIAVIGGGAWGTALSIHLARAGRDVRLWMVERDLAARMRERRDNPVYLPGARVPDRVIPTSDLEEALRNVDSVVAVVPSQHARGVYTAMAPVLPAGVPVVLATKGIEEGSLALPLEVGADVLGAGRPLAVLSGPSFAREVARGNPAAIVVASPEAGLAQAAQENLSSPTLRMYTNTDPVGVQVAGALKNVIAIAAGVVDGLGMGHNALAALITRGLAEVTRLGCALGGDAATFSGLAGLGDLVLTCTGTLSRNRGLGIKLAGGERLEDILCASRSVVEGVRTTMSARELAARARIEMPIVEEVHRILYEDGSPQEAVVRLMSRPLTAENPEP